MSCIICLEQYRCVLSIFLYDVSFYYNMYLRLQASEEDAEDLKSKLESLRRCLDLDRQRVKELWDEKERCPGCD